MMRSAQASTATRPREGIARTKDSKSAKVRTRAVDYNFRAVAGARGGALYCHAASVRRLWRKDSRTGTHRLLGQDGVNIPVVIVHGALRWLRKAKTRCTTGDDVARLRGNGVDAMALERLWLGNKDVCARCFLAFEFHDRGQK